MNSIIGHPTYFLICSRHLCRAAMEKLKTFEKVQSIIWLVNEDTLKIYSVNKSFLVPPGYEVH